MTAAAESRSETPLGRRVERDVGRGGREHIGGAGGGVTVIGGAGGAGTNVKFGTPLARRVERDVGRGGGNASESGGGEGGGQLHQRELQRKHLKIPEKEGWRGGGQQQPTQYPQTS